GFVGLGLAALLGNLETGLLQMGLPESTVARLVANKGWRIMMILGTTPALLTFFIRLFVPESQRWEEEKERGATSGWATHDLLGVLVGVCGPALIVYLWAWEGPGWLPHTLGLRVGGTVIGVLTAVAGYTYPLVRYLQRHAAATPGEGRWGPTLGR